MFDAAFLDDLFAFGGELFLPILVATMVVAAIGAAILRIDGGGPLRSNLAFLLAFAALGAVPGLIAGWSREPVTGALLTGLLGLLSAMLAYLFGKESLASFRPVIPVLILVLLFGAVAGLGIGGIKKKEWDQYERAYTDYRAKHDQQAIVVAREVDLMGWRLKYGIDNDGKRLTPQEPSLAASESNR